MRFEVMHPFKLEMIFKREVSSYLIKIRQVWKVNHKSLILQSQFNIP